MQLVRNWGFLLGFVFTVLPVHSATDIPMRVAGVVLNDPIPPNSLRITGSPYRELYELPALIARHASKELLGVTADEFSNYFSAVDGNAAEIVLSVRDPNYVALRRKLSNLYGKANPKLIAGEGACNDVEVTTWRGSGSTVVLAVIRPDTQSGTALLAELHFRSNSLYSKLKARQKVAYDKHYKQHDPPECNQQHW
jgi:hypothetical protein